MLASLLFTKFDFNYNGVIMWNEFWLTSNRYAVKEMVPEDK